MNICRCPESGAAAVGHVLAGPGFGSYEGMGRGSIQNSVGVNFHLTPFSAVTRPGSEYPSYLIAIWPRTSPQPKHMSSVWTVSKGIGSEAMSL